MRAASIFRCEDSDLGSENLSYPIHSGVEYVTAHPRKRKSGAPSRDDRPSAGGNAKNRFLAGWSPPRNDKIERALVAQVNLCPSRFCSKIYLSCWRL